MKVKRGYLWKNGFVGLTLKDLIMSGDRGQIRPNYKIDIMKFSASYVVLEIMKN